MIGISAWRSPFEFWPSGLNPIDKEAIHSTQLMTVRAVDAIGLVAGANFNVRLDRIEVGGNFLLGDEWTRAC